MPRRHPAAISFPAPERVQVLRVPRKLPRGAYGLPQDVVLLSQQSRIVEGTARAVAEKGYARASVADIIAHAGVSRTTFYALFEDKEACFLACFEALAQQHLRAAEEALNRAAPAPERLLAGLHAYLERIDADQAFARAFIGEAEAATPETRAAFLRARSRLEAALRRWLRDTRRAHPEVPDCGATVMELVNTALAAFVVDNVRAGRPLLPEVPAIAAFLFAACGMPAWAQHMRAQARTVRG